MLEHMFEKGQIFGERYRIDHLLARGGFGAVYVAEQMATEAYVALKILWPHILSSEVAVASFQQEARIAGRVKSEHIVSVLDAGFDERTAMPFLVMELLHGQDLQRLVEQSGPVAPDLTVGLMRQVASALDKAHSYKDRDGTIRPIVHRDLKPENLFLTRRENGEPLVKVLDFGIAKVVSATAKVSREVKGTPLYMAFEQAGGGAITPRTDIWALGLIVYFLLTGKSYWRAAQSEEASLTQLFGEVLSMPIVAPSSRLAELGQPVIFPPAFDDWFLCCMNRDPEQRFRTAGIAVSALGEALGVAVMPSSSYTLPDSANTGLPASAPTPMAATPNAVGAVAGRSAPGDLNPTLESARMPGGTAQGIALATGAPYKKPSLWLPLIAGGALLVGLVGGGLLLLRARTSASLAPADPEPARADLAATAAPSVAASAAEATTPDVVAPTTPTASTNPATNAPDAGKKATGGQVSRPATPSTSAPSTEKGKGKTGGKDEGLYGER